MPTCDHVRKDSICIWGSSWIGCLCPGIQTSHGPGYRRYFVCRGETLILLPCDGDKGSQEWDLGIAQQQLAGEIDDEDDEV